MHRERLPSRNAAPLPHETRADVLRKAIVNELQRRENSKDNK